VFLMPTTKPHQFLTALAAGRSDPDADTGQPCCEKVPQAVTGQSLDDLLPDTDGQRFYH
jgi:hypothetical protein